MSDEQRERLDMLTAKRDADIDTSDSPEVLDWSSAARGHRSEIDRVPRQHVAIREIHRA